MNSKFLGWLKTLRNKSEIIASCYTFLVQKHNLYFIYILLYGNIIGILFAPGLSFLIVTVLNIRRKRV